MARRTPVLSRGEAKLITRRRLLDAGLGLLGEEGYENLTTGRIAAAAGVAQPTFYVHFADKDDLLRCLAEEVTSRLREALRQARRKIEHAGSDDPIRAAFRLPLLQAAHRQ